jgi:hypothetical protein
MTGSRFLSSTSGLHLQRPCYTGSNNLDEVDAPRALRALDQLCHAPCPDVEIGTLWWRFWEFKLWFLSSCCLLHHLHDHQVGQIRRINNVILMSNLAREHLKGKVAVVRMCSVRVEKTGLSYVTVPIPYCFYEDGVQTSN